MSEVTNAPKSTAVKTGEQISEISKENLFADEKEKFTKVFETFFSFNFFTFQLVSNAANLAAARLNLNSWLSAFYPF